MDRCILFPESFRLVPKAHLAANPDVYLFESRNRQPYTARRIQQIVPEHEERAGILKHVQPHVFRHQLLTWLTSQGISDAQIRLISGHSSKKSLEVYQHLNLADVQAEYQKAVRNLQT